MQVVEGNTVRKIREPQRASARFSEPRKPYVFEIDKKTGGLYLRPERSALLGELPFAALLAAAVLFAVLSYCRFIRLQTSAECHVRTISGLESEYYRLSSENELAVKELSQIEDLNHIYEVATTELGMVPATADTVRLYERTNSEFVYQTDNVLPFTARP